VSAGVPHDTLREEQLAEIQQMADAPSDAYSAGEWCFALNMTLAELARVSREHETMRDALRSMEEPCPDCEGRGDDCGWCGNTGLVLKPAPEVASILQVALAGSRAATPEDGQ
jgi:hypothetical protein